ncbi:hypothetical protein PC129_g25262 [Phytophthora cactorum]|uniref:CBM1 domain-containing protein n=2 Tax=Eukaryota TaxID=2759 RepID=A0A0N8H5J4_9HYPO|nr:hypothetical protein PC129_g25262 [Phytophthora cactorum]KPM36340.1 hypothetical protein AK830_g10231 [Neonectria ditissima]
MHISTALVAVLATFAAAAPKSYGCKPGTYACKSNAKGWQVCNTEGVWVDGGKCPPKTVCKFYPPSLSPYCVPPDFEFP